MNWMEFVSSLVGSLVWPAAILVLIFLLRGKLEPLLSGIRRLKAGPGGVELDYFDRIAADAQPGSIELEESTAGSGRLYPPGSLRSELEKRARDHPKDAVTVAYGRIEKRLHNLLGPDVPPAAHVNMLTLAGLAAANGLIDQETLRSIEGLNVLRNLAIHSREGELSPGQAMEFLDLADATLFALRNQLRSK